MTIREPLSTLLIPLLIAAAPPTEPIAPLRPIAPWKIDYGESACTLSRGFGDGARQVGLAISPRPLDNWIDVTLLLPVTGKRSAAVTMKIAAEDVEPTLISAREFDAPTLGRRAVKGVALGAILYGTFKGDQPIAIAVDDRAAIRLAGGDLAKPFAALQACVADLKRNLGIDPAATLVSAARFRHNPAGRTLPGRFINVSAWFDAADYPAEALLKGTTGNVLALWRVGLDHRAHDCRVLRSSGSSQLDAATCNAILRKGTYRPVKDDNGKQVETWDSEVISWRIASDMTTP